MWGQEQGEKAHKTAVLQPESMFFAAITFRHPAGNRRKRRLSSYFRDKCPEIPGNPGRGRSWYHEQGAGRLANAVADRPAGPSHAGRRAAAGVRDIAAVGRGQSRVGPAVRASA